MLASSSPRPSKGPKSISIAPSGQTHPLDFNSIAAMGGEHDDIVSSFLAVTGASDAQAHFFLESTNWELEAALISFFEAADEGVASMNPGDEDDEDEEKSLPVPVRVHALGASQQAGGNRQGVGAWPGRSTESTQGHGRGHSNSQSKGKEKGSFKKGSSSRGGITTLSDLTRQPDSDGDSDEGPQEYYTGGEKRLALAHNYGDLK